MYYLISGWDDYGNQIVQIHKGNNVDEAEIDFLLSIGGGEVNEILDIISDEEYERSERQMKKTYPCDNPDGFCPYDAEGGYDCRHFCGLGVDESENLDEND